MQQKLQVLLVEPAYKNKYPPLGLMKIAAFHKDRGDVVHFVKGLKKEIKNQLWDRIYVTTLFSFYWKQTINTIKYYEFSVRDPQGFFIGGPMATIMADEIEQETGFKVVKGLLNEKGKLRIAYDYKVDSLVPDYSILDGIDYKYPANNAYFSYTTRGCKRKCPFCAVYIIEPVYEQYIPLKKQIELINEKYGQKKDLLLLDNNILASPQLTQIVDEIKAVGFFKGATLNGKKRYVDFNQGIDLRLLSEEKMKLLAELPIRPLRIAFDHIRLKESYIKKIELAAKYGLIHLSNYILYNFEDTPEDLYERLKINIDLNEKLGISIFSFPMKYIPIRGRDRTFVGDHWTRRNLRGVQCILNATHGVVGPKRKFFEAAFGKNVREFKKLILMPDDYIIYRKIHENNGAAEWNKLYESLNKKQKMEFRRIISDNRFDEKLSSKYTTVNKLIEHYY